MDATRWYGMTVGGSLAQAKSDGDSAGASMPACDWSGKEEGRSKSLSSSQRQSGIHLSKQVDQMKIGTLSEMLVNGQLRIWGAFDNGTKIDCVVYLPLYYISLQGVNRPPRPVVAATHDGQGLPDNMVTALRVQNITAEPKKMALGSHLMLRAAERAKDRGVHHLLAMKVNPTTNGWYARMGFTEYDSAEALHLLTQQEAQIKQQLQNAPSQNHVEMLSPALESVMMQKADMIRFAVVDNVIAKARTDWDARWERDGNGWKSKGA